jgi:hypothetical protein
MHPLRRPESARDHLRRRKQSPSPAMRPLRGCHRPRNRLQPPPPPLSETQPRPNAHLRKRPVEEKSTDARVIPIRETTPSRNSRPLTQPIVPESCIIS